MTAVRSARIDRTWTEGAEVARCAPAAASLGVSAESLVTEVWMDTWMDSSHESADFRFYAILV